MFSTRIEAIRRHDNFSFHNGHGAHGTRSNAKRVFYMFDDGPRPESVECTFISGQYLLRCGASRAHVPSDFELNEYCKSYMHKVCPIYMKRPDLHGTQMGSGHSGTED